MRKLVYIGKNTENDFIKTYSYEVKQKAEENGYRFKTCFEQIYEKTVYDCYKDGKLAKTVETTKERKEAREKGFEIKLRTVEYTNAAALV